MGAAGVALGLGLGLCKDTAIGTREKARKWTCKTLQEQLLTDKCSFPSFSQKMDNAGKPLRLLGVDTDTRQNHSPGRSSPLKPILAYPALAA